MRFVLQPVCTDTGPFNCLVTVVDNAISSAAGLVPRGAVLRRLVVDATSRCFVLAAVLCHGMLCGPGLRADVMLLLCCAGCVTLM